MSDHDDVPDVSVLIVDDQRPFRMAARAVVGRAEGFAVVGDVDDGDGVVEAVERLRPDLVLMDVMMARVDGIEATRRALSVAPSTSVVLCSTYALSEAPGDVTSCGAVGYLRKEQLSPDALRLLWERRGEGVFRTFE